jgi:hypothetical protein
MGFRSTFVTDDCNWEWPQWFRDRYKASVHFPVEGGPISSVCEGKTYGVFADVATDIQIVLRDIGDKYRTKLVLVFLHECGGITRCEITPDAIKWTEPASWRATEGVAHEYCYGCSDADNVVE